MQEHPIAFAGEMVAPEFALFADDELSVVIFPHPTEGGRGLEPDLSFAEGELSALEHEPE